MRAQVSAIPSTARSQPLIRSQTAPARMGPPNPPWTWCHPVPPREGQDTEGQHISSPGHIQQTHVSPPQLPTVCHQPLAPPWPPPQLPQKLQTESPTAEQPSSRGPCREGGCDTPTQRFPHGGPKEAQFPSVNQRQTCSVQRTTMPTLVLCPHGSCSYDLKYAAGPAGVLCTDLVWAFRPPLLHRAAW